MFFMLKPEGWLLYVAEDKKGGLTHTEIESNKMYTVLCFYFVTVFKPSLPLCFMIYDQISRHFIFPFSQKQGGLK